MPGPCHLSVGSPSFCRGRERTCEHRVRRRSGNKLEEKLWHVYITRGDIGSSWGPALCTGSSAWWWPRGLGLGHGKEAQRRGDICIRIGDSHCSTAETSTTSQSKYPPIERKEVHPFLMGLALYSSYLLKFWVFALSTIIIMWPAGLTEPWTGMIA